MSSDNSDVTMATQEIAPSSQDFDLQRIAAHENFATQVTIAALKKKELQIQPVLSAIEINNSKARAEYIKGKTNLFKKDVIQKGILFLESLFPQKSPSSEAGLKDMRIDVIKNKLVKLLTAISPNYCNNCDLIFENSDDSKVNCYICTSNLCQNCSSEEAFSNAKAAMSNIFAICSSCQEEHEEAIVDKEIKDDTTDDGKNKKDDAVAATTNAEKNNPIEVVVIVETNENSTNAVEKESTSDTIEDNEAPFQLVKNKNKNKSDKSEKSVNSIQVDKSDKPDPQKKVCTFYIQYRCKFGPAGKDCSFDHPKICKPFMKSNLEGCKKGENCQYLHPKMCPKSGKGQNCNSLKCFKKWAFHGVKGHVYKFL